MADRPTCDARMRPFPNDLELACEWLAGHGREHKAVLRDYAYPGSETTITWDEEDRRTFRGEWSPCAAPGCILPRGHHGPDAF